MKKTSEKTARHAFVFLQAVHKVAIQFTIITVAFIVVCGTQ
jgi:hypothetical protein